jgi:hypothetical protein
VRDRRSGGRERPPGDDEHDNAAWKLLWVLVGAVTFTFVMYFLDLI